MKSQITNFLFYIQILSIEVMNQFCVNIKKRHGISILKTLFRNDLYIICVSTD